MLTDTDKRELEATTDIAKLVKQQSNGNPMVALLLRNAMESFTAGWDARGLAERTA